MIILFFIVIFAIDLLFCTATTSDYLSHVIMPFPIKQIEDVKANINSWSRFQPCSQDFTLLSSNTTQVNFIFFVSSSENEKIRKELINYFNSYPSSKCFKSVSVEFANLGKDDSYLKGSRLMFEQMISKKLNYGNNDVSHVFYMEPDCSPIRSNWLHAINQQIIPLNTPFWMKGSIFRGKMHILKTMEIYNHIHINGNAIYNVRSDDFRKFYFEIVRPFINDKFKEGAYDTDIYKVLLWQQAKYTASFFHLFQFSDFIQNHWHSEYSLNEILDGNPNTFLIHGGYAHE